MPATTLLSSEAAAEMLQVSVGTLRKWVREGRLAVIRPAGGRTRIRFRQEDVEALMVPRPEQAAS